ncbi:MAG TPA: M20 family metallopeptidase, partial [Bacteroidales bacterium]|nr:M20 family metallopeptidase [Bacteroidales bacterium]
MHSPTPPMLSPDPGAVRERALKMHDRLIDWRRHLHRHPELSEQEFQTSAFIQEVLTSLGIPFTAGVADTGVVGLIEGMMPGQGCVALRADMDALPIAEANAVDYRSQNPGVMHACGHDAHTASLLGAAALLQEMRAGFGGTVKLLFQPSEEQYPGGAIRMIREGVLEDPNPAFIFGQHVLPTLDTGKVGFHPGPAMASTDEVHLTVIGRGGHGATPELVTDPVTAAAHILIALQQVVSRKANPLLPTVLSFGRVIADGRTNIIPDQVEMHGILRTFDETWRTQAREHITRIAQQTAAAFG